MVGNEIFLQFFYQKHSPTYLICSQLKTILFKFLSYNKSTIMHQELSVSMCYNMTLVSEFLLPYVWDQSKYYHSQDKYCRADYNCCLFLLAEVPFFLNKIWKIKTAGDLVWHLKLYVTEEMKEVYQAKLILDGMRWIKQQSTTPPKPPLPSFLDITMATTMSHFHSYFKFSSI